MELGKMVLDRELVDCHDRRGGKVDDLLLEMGEPDEDGHLPAPEVVAILSGPLALEQDMAGVVRRVARFLYRLLGLRDPQPVAIPWWAVTAIDVVVHVAVDRDTAGLTALADAVDRRLIGHLPGAGARP